MLLLIITLNEFDAFEHLGFSNSEFIQQQQQQENILEFFFLKHIKVLFKFFLMHSNNGRINFLMSDFFSDWNNNNCVNDIIVQYIRFVEFLPYNEILNEYFLIRF